MIQYEAKLDGSVELGEQFSNFNEVQVLKDIFEDLGWSPFVTAHGLGGYLCFHLTINGQVYKVHIYLKKVTFGGRANRLHEKRAQFSAGLDRRGFAFTQFESNELSLILAIYKREIYEDSIICAWDIHDWGYNAGRAFNCFVSIDAIAKAFVNGLSQHVSANGQIACCFIPDKFSYYFNNRSQLHRQEFENFDDTIEIQSEELSVPRYDTLFQPLVDFMKGQDGAASVEDMELGVANFLELSPLQRELIHNPREGLRTELGYQLAWARNYLKRAGMLDNPQRGMWVLTDSGWATSEINPSDIMRMVPQSEILRDVGEENLSEAESIEGVETEDDSSSFSIQTPFDPNLVDIRTKTMSLDLLIKRLVKDEIDLNTSFQRKANLWNRMKQSRLIESILVKFPLPAFYFDGSDDNKWLVVDGLQRLSAIDNYVNKQTFGLENPEFLTQFEGLKFSELPGYLQRRIEEFEITAYVISAGTPKVLKYNVFKRINTGGLTLTSQEIRNALNQGTPSTFVKSLADLGSFKRATDYSVPQDRMLDREFVTRFLAFYLLDIEAYNSDLDGFLNKAMESLNDLSVDERSDVLQNFNKSMQASYAIFGRDSFRKRYHLSDKRKPINKALFEVWSVTLANCDDRELSALIANRNEVINRFISALRSDDEFHAAVSSSTGDKNRIKKRFQVVRNIVESLIL